MSMITFWKLRYIINLPTCIWKYLVLYINLILFFITLSKTFNSPLVNQTEIHVCCIELFHFHFLLDLNSFKKKNPLYKLVTVVHLYYELSISYITNKRGFVQIIPPRWGLSYQFDWHTINRSRR